MKPTQNIPVAFTDHKSGARRFENAFWSLLPVWAKQRKPAFPTFNARSETAAEKRTFAPALAIGRCAIPVSAFYEWTGAKGARVPHAIFGPEPILALAGLCGWWHEPGAPRDAGWHLTATILTRASAGVMAPLHDRMPVFLAADLTAEWLDPGSRGTDLLPAVSEASRAIADELREYPVAPLRGDGPQLLDPAPAALDISG